MYVKAVGRLTAITSAFPYEAANLENTLCFAKHPYGSGLR